MGRVLRAVVIYSWTMKRTFVIGDVHGNYDRLRALLIQEGIIDEKENRIDHETEVVQLGDLGDFGKNGSPTGDFLCYHAAYYKDWIDRVLWGNHDRAVFDYVHAFTGYREPQRETKEIMAKMAQIRQLVMSWSADGHLLTHAGLHPYFFSGSANPFRFFEGQDAFEVSSLINNWTRWGGARKGFVSDAISTHRGGRDPIGGVLWRHSGESLYKGFPQIFGHTSKPKIRKYGTKKHGVWSYCIDLGSKTNGRLAGMWLPENKAVGVVVH